MDVRTKFVLSMLGLAAVVISLGVFVYISATSNPFTEQEEIVFRPVVVDTPSVGLTTLFPGGGTDEPAETGPAIIGTITLGDTQTPEKEEQRNVTVLQPNEARYAVHMSVSWSPLQHGDQYPEGAHLSPMVAWSHRMENTVFATGTPASDGMEIMAETGGTATLIQELRAFGSEGRLYGYGIGKRIDAPGEDRVTLVLSHNAPFASAVSMIAPSPDWFISAHNVPLFENGQWVKRRSVSAVLYDAGTDDGLTFTARNADTQPPEPIGRLEGAPVVPIATFDFIRIDEN